MTELTGHTGCVNALGWSGDDQFIVSGSDDKCINLYKAMGKEKKPQFRFYTGHQSNIFQEGGSIKERSFSVKNDLASESQSSFPTKLIERS